MYSEQHAFRWTKALVIIELRVVQIVDDAYVFQRRGCSRSEKTRGVSEGKTLDLLTSERRESWK